MPTRQIIYKNNVYNVSYIKYKVSQYSRTEYLLFLDTDKENFLILFRDEEKMKKLIDDLNSPLFQIYI